MAGRGRASCARGGLPAARVRFSPADFASLPQCSHASPRPRVPSRNDLAGAAIRSTFMPSWTSSRCVRTRTAHRLHHDLSPRALVRTDPASSSVRRRSGITQRHHPWCTRFDGASAAQCSDRPRCEASTLAMSTSATECTAELLSSWPALSAREAASFKQEST